MPANEVMVDFHVLANMVRGLNNKTISTFTHSLFFACLSLLRLIFNDSDIYNFFKKCI